MALLLVYKTYQPNTAPTNRFMAFVKGLSELGVKIRVCFFTSDGKGTKVKEVYNNTTFDYYWDRHPVSSPLRKFYDLVSVIKFIRGLNKGDVVYIYGFPFLLMILSWINKCRCYYEIDECPDVYITKSSFINMTKDRLIKSLKKITGVIVISQALKEYFVENGIEESRISVVNMIVDSGRFTEIKKKPSEKYIAYCGTVSLYKDGVDQLLKAFAVFSRQHQEYKLYVIGKIPSATDEKELMSLVKELRIESKVVFTGMISFLKMPQVLKNAEMLALARPDNIQAKYGFPTKLGEYLLTENPVVVTRVGDIPTFLKDKDSALLAEADRPELFAEQMSWAVDHPQAAAEIGTRGAKIAQTYFNYLKESNKLLKVLINDNLICNQ